jgi:hypothetical protein
MAYRLIASDDCQHTWFRCESCQDRDCAYCGLKELDICSPLVCGQSRGEHDAHLRMSKAVTADGYLDKNGLLLTAYSFLQ